ncbi:hypothetical protein [Algibacter sp. PT7-4]|uniref:hypothetical protein n=1 Tax=Algibacter ulvanivorans TaxID=3400999 RepID=UPI003AAD37DE
MKPLVLFLFLINVSLAMQAQIDNSKKKSIAIPAIESETASKAITPSKSNKNTNTFEINSPKVAPKLDEPQKKFSMLPAEEFGDPGELYSKKLIKKQKELLPEGHGLNSGLKKDAFWGDYRTTSKYINILLRDYSEVDGDLLRVYVNDEIIKSDIYLTQGYTGFKLNLVEGINKIDFFAINTGDYGPNTAAYKIVDDNIKVISSKVWALAAGVRVTLIIVKE